MSSDGQWPTMTLAEAGVVLLDCVHKTPPKADTGYPYLSIPEMVNGHLDLEAARRICHQDFVEWTRKVAPQAHDVVLSRRCNPGETAYVPPNAEFALGQNLVLLRADGRYVYPPFLRWLTRSSEWWEQVRTFLNVGAVFDSLKCADVPNFRVPIPPLGDQQRITKVLDRLDDKIELNRRMNATLEAMAQALFKSWFVDFNPVRAKIEGREPAGMDAETAALFPDGFEVVDGREVPVGWNIGSLTTVVDVLGGGTPKTTVDEYWDGQIPWFSVVDAPNLSDVFVIDTEKKITELGLNNSSARILPVGTTIITARGTVGKIALVAVPMAMNQSCYGLLGKGGYGPFFTYFLTQNVVSVLKQNTHGSVFDTITRQTLKDACVIIPKKEVCEAFEKQVEPLLKCVKNNLFESRTLAALRDTLLPKLISGETRVPVGEEQRRKSATV